MSTKLKNELYLEKMELTDKYLELHEKLRNDLNLASLCISKAKLNHGISLFSVNAVDTHDLEPCIRLKESDGKFKLLESEDEDKNSTNENNENETKNCGETEDVEDSSNKKLRFRGQFRPFGVLEPAAAKDARRIYKASIQTILDLVSTQQLIISKSRDIVDN